MKRMTVKLNFPLDGKTPTVNGRIYTKSSVEELRESLQYGLDRNILFIYSKYFNPAYYCGNLKDIAVKVEMIIEDPDTQDIRFVITPLDTPGFKDIRDKLYEGRLQVTVSGCGNEEENANGVEEIRSFQLGYLFFTEDTL